MKEKQTAMNIQKMKQNRILMTVLQGFLLLVILSTLFSVCISLLMTGVRADLKDLNEKIASQQITVTEGDEQKAIEGLEALNAATEALEGYNDNSETQRILTVIMYAAFALLFLLKASITRDHWRLNLFRYGIGALLFAACAGIFLFTDSAKAYLPVTLLHVTALTVDHIYSIIRKHRLEGVGEFEIRIELKNEIIKQINMMGDYFLVGDIDNRLLLPLRNVPYTKESVEKALPNRVDDIILNLDKKDLIEMIFND